MSPGTVTFTHGEGGGGGGQAGPDPAPRTRGGRCRSRCCSRDPAEAIPPLHGALLKNEQDVMLFERLAFMSRRQGG